MKKFIIANVLIIIASMIIPFFIPFDTIMTACNLPVTYVFYINMSLTFYYLIFGAFLSLYCIYQTIFKKSILAALVVIPLIAWCGLWTLMIKMTYQHKDRFIQILQDKKTTDDIIKQAHEAGTTASIAEINAPEELANYIRAHENVIVKCSAQWCPPCKAMKPIVEAAAITYADKIAFVAIDSDASPALAESLSIQGLPTFIAYKNGAEAFRFVGFKTKAEFELELEKLLGLAMLP